MVSRRQQQLDGKIDGLLSPNGDEDLVGMGDDAPPCEDTLYQLLDQHLVVDRGVVGRPARDLDNVDGIAHAFPPARDREEGRVNEAAHERASVSHEAVRGFYHPLEIEAAAREELPIVHSAGWHGDIARRITFQRVTRIRT